MKRPQLISPGTLSRMLRDAEESWKRKDFDQNIEILERASRLAPANVPVLLQLGRVYGLRYDYAAAERCFEKAVRVSPRKAEVLSAVGEQCRDFRQTGLAEHYFRSSLEQKDTSPETFVHLAELYERLRRTQEAAELVERALRLNGACAPALLAKARQHRQSGQFEEAEKLLRSFPENAERPVRVRAWYELAGVLDRLRRYDEAMTAFLQAKALLREEARPFAAELKTIRARLEVMQTTVAAEIMERWFDADQTLQPPCRLAMLCGHPRSGTTLLEQVLDSHPDIVSAEETEIFHDEAYVPLTRGAPENAPMLAVLESASPGALQRSRDNYSRLMDLCLGTPVGDRLLIDKNPSLIFLIPALVRVFPEVKFLVALRDPRDVCLSCFMQPLVPIGQVSSAYLSLEGTVDEYVSLMSIWRTLSPLLKNPFLEVRYEDVVEDLGKSARQVLGFLEIPWDAHVLHFDEHARQKLVRSPTYAEVVKPVFKTAIGRWKNYEKYLAPHLEKLAPFVKAFGYE